MSGRLNDENIQLVASSALYVIQIMDGGVLDASSLATFGPCDAIKSSVDITIDGQPTDKNDSSELLDGFPVTGGQWDATGWRAISAISGTTPDVWAGWYKKPQRG